MQINFQKIAKSAVENKTMECLTRQELNVIQLTGQIEQLGLLFNSWSYYNVICVYRNQKFGRISEIGVGVPCGVMKIFCILVFISVDLCVCYNLLVFCINSIC